MSISHTSRGFEAYCHKCGFRGFTPLGFLSISELGKYREAAEAEKKKQAGGIRLPADFTQNIDLSGLLWLWRYGITDDEIHDFSIGWSPYLNRVILPVYDDSSSLVYWQGRAVGKGQSPKYLNIKGAENASNIFTRSTGDSGRVVIVEDILSAIKVGRVSTSLCILGARVHRDLYPRLRGKEVHLWYDNDDAGRKAERQFKRAFGSLVRPNCIRTHKDPKEYSTRRIKEIIHGSSNQK